MFLFLCLVINVQIPLSSTNEDLQPQLAAKRRVIALNKKDLANPNIMHVNCLFLASSFFFFIGKVEFLELFVF